jgi:hypothetical protein
LIRSNRGKVLIPNREGLKLAANGFYGVPEAVTTSATARMLLGRRMISTACDFQS